MDTPDMSDQKNLSELDQLRLQSAARNAERAQAELRVALLLFEQERTRIGQVYGLTSADSVDCNSGVITLDPLALHLPVKEG
jgi:hypothetical protein